MRYQRTLLVTLLVTPLAVALPASFASASVATESHRLGFETATLGQDPARGRDADRSREREDERARRAREAEIARWHDRMPHDDRAALDILVGYESPALADDLRWFNGERASLESMRGKVVVIQAFTTRATRTAPARLHASLGDRREQGLVLLALHTPDGGDRAAAALEQLDVDLPLLLDESGITSDRFGIFRRPVNIVIDRVGNVRFAGLTERGLESAVETLLAETPDPAAKPRQRERETPSEVRWPAFTGSVGSARDLRGQRSPEFHVADWIRDEDQARGRLTVLDFWATWCGPCIRMIPHMNEIADNYRETVFVVGISDEGRGAFQRGMVQRNLRMSSFAYSLALDPEGRMKTAFGIRGIPHVAVVSTDGIVRWQGHPQGLTRGVMDQLVEANEQLRGVAPEAPTAPPARWAQQNRRAQN